MTPTPQSRAAVALAEATVKWLDKDGDDKAEFAARNSALANYRRARATPEPDLTALEREWCEACMAYFSEWMDTTLVTGDEDARPFSKLKRAYIALAASRQPAPSALEALEDALAIGERFKTADRHDLMLGKIRTAIAALKSQEAPHA